MKIEKIFGEFIRYAQDRHLTLEGIAVADQERVLLEHHFTADRPRNIYSHTKSYMAAAVGIAVERGMMSLEDRLSDYFPEKLPEQPSEYLLRIRLCDLLTMSSGFGREYLMGEGRRSGEGMPDYMEYMMSRPVPEIPGSRFCYSTADSILAGRMVEKAVGMRLEEFLYRELFSRMGQGYPIWEADPQGHPIGGGGMFMKLTDMMKIGQLYLAEGKWNGEKILSSEWVHRSSSRQIETEPSDDIWRCGYGYQFWMCPYPDSFRADGAFGQITLVLPHPGLAVSVQCPENGCFEKVKQALHEHLLLPLSEE